MFDRTEGDPGNVVELGHVNLRVPDPVRATAFYVTGLGLTRDPYLVTGITNMWINAGRTQFHLPTGSSQVLRGEITLVVPAPDGLPARLESVRQALAGTQFGFAQEGEAMRVTCPWGNRLRCVSPANPRLPLGIASVWFAVPRAALPGIAEFYRDILAARAAIDGDNVTVSVGEGQTLVFDGAAEAAPRTYDGHHIQITLADFSGPYRRLLERGLISQEDDPHQYRFRDIINPATGEVLFQVEHEVRSLRHPMFGRPLVNRNPDQGNREYRPGRDDFVPPVLALASGSA